VSREKLRHQQETSSLEFMELLAIRPGMTVVDIGAGTGQQAIAIAERVGDTGKVFATEIRADLVELMKIAAATRGLRNLTPVLVRAPGLDAFYSLHTYDLILMNNVSVARKVDAQYFAALHPLLKPGGRLVQNVDYPRPFYPPFERSDFTDLRGFMTSLASEPLDSPYLDVLPGPVLVRLLALGGDEPAPELADAIIKALNDALLDPQFVYRFVDGGRFIDDRFPSQLEADRAILLLDSLLDHVKLTTSSIAIEDACRLNNRLFVRRFQSFLDPAWLAPNWRGKPYGEAAEQRARNLELLQQAGWSLRTESWDIVPFHYVWVLD
jgi:SAM-dependent methyltransferase